MKIYLVRHGQTQMNAEKKYLGRGGSPFTELGAKQNKNALKKLMQEDIDAVYSSPSERCMSMARELAAKKKIKAAIDERISEIDFGVFEGLTWQGAKKDYPDGFKELCNNPQEYVFPNGESQSDLDKRTALFIRDILKSPHENIAVFSHGGAIMSILSQLLQLDPGQKWRFKISHGSCITVEVCDGFAYLVL